MNNAKIINTFQNDVAPGSINTLRQLTQTQYININSKYRNGAMLSSTTDFQISLPANINRVSEMEVTHVEFPTYGYYMFSSDLQNNIFWVQSQSTTPFEINILDGNYTPQQLVTYLNSIYFNPTNPYPLSNIQLYFNPTNFKYSFEVTGSTDFTLTFYNLDTKKLDVINTIGWQMGFMSPLYAYSAPDSGVLVAEMPVNLFSNRCIYLSLNDFQYNNNNSNLVVLKNSSCLDDFLLCKIVLPAVVYDDVYTEYAKTRLVSFPRKYNGPVNFKKFEIKLYDEDGNKVVLNGLDFSFTLKLTLVYETL